MPQNWLDTEGRIATATPCAHCGYDLRMRRVDEICTECGRPVSDLLRLAPGWWLRRVRLGAVILILAVGFQEVAEFVLPKVTEMPMPTLGQTVTRATWTIWVEQVCLAVPVLALLLGGWLVTLPHPRPGHSWRGSKLRRAGRVALLALLVLQMGTQLRYEFESIPFRKLEPLLDVGQAAAMFATELLVALSLVAVAGMSWNWMRKKLARLVVLVIAVTAAFAVPAAIARASLPLFPEYPFAIQFPQTPNPFFYVFESRYRTSYIANLPESVPIWQPNQPESTGAYRIFLWAGSVAIPYERYWMRAVEGGRVLLAVVCLSVLSVAVRQQRYAVVKPR